jgi:nucleotide-binding universal stress UspA family protein
MSKEKIRILLALDGSDQSFEAARYVSQFFLPSRLDLVLFHVSSNLPESFWDLAKRPTYKEELAPLAAWSRQEETRIQEFMERGRRMFIDEGVSEDSLEIHIEEKQVGIARDILHKAQTSCDLVVVGRWGMNKLKDLVWGGVANKLIGHLVDCPLCVVGGKPRTGKILVALDTSEEAMRTVDFVGTIIKGKDWEVTFFHVIREDYFTSPRYQTSFVLHKEWEGTVRKKFHEAEKAIVAVYEEAMKRLQKAGVNPDFIATKTVTGVASRGKAIFDEARKGHFGTIVVGRRGLSRVDEFLLGRVSNKVLQLAKEMAVWVVH